MPQFGKRSRERLKGVDSQLVNVLNEVVKYFDITVIEGVRTKERQAELVAGGKSQTKHSKHLTGEAVDVAPFPIDFQARDDFHYLGGFILGVASQMGIDIRWGGDWSDSSLTEGRRTTKDNNFDDLVHIELV